MTKTAAGATFVGSATSIFGGLSANELAAMGGLLVGLAGLAINLYFNWKRDQREQLEHEARMKGFSSGR